MIIFYRENPLAMAQVIVRSWGFYKVFLWKETANRVLLLIISCTLIAVEC